jgi:hypothetical protein
MGSEDVAICHHCRRSATSARSGNKTTSHARMARAEILRPGEATPARFRARHQERPKGNPRRKTDEHDANRVTRWRPAPGRPVATSLVQRNPSLGVGGMRIGISLASAARSHPGCLLEEATYLQAKHRWSRSDLEFRADTRIFRIARNLSLYTSADVSEQRNKIKRMFSAHCSGSKSYSY